MRRVLLAADSEFFRSVLSATLEGLPELELLGTDLVEAAGRLAAFGPDVVVLDAIDQKAAEFARNASAACPRARIVAVSLFGGRAPGWGGDEPVRFVSDDASLEELFLAMTGDRAVSGPPD